MVLFDPKIIHRATISKDTYRDVLFLQVRPATFKPRSYIDPRWTGSFQHRAYQLDPGIYKPLIVRPGGPKE